MRHYTGVIVKIDCLETTVEMWSEHNHASLYRDDVLLLDGYHPEVSLAMKREIDRLCGIAEKYGRKAEVVRK